MDLVALIQGLIASYPVLATIAGILGSLVVLGQVVVVLTPSKSDDLAWEQLKSIPILGPILSALTSFAFIQKK